MLVECDTGMGRCGVQNPGEALALARLIAAAPGLTFQGLMTYPAAGKVEANASWLAAAVDLLTRENLPPAVVSNGGTPDLWRAGEVAVATEHRPGTYIYLDRSQVARGVGSLDDCALTVLATVVSRPTADRAIIDAGSKTLTSDTLGMDGFGLVLEYPDAIIRSLSEEHGAIDLSASAKKPVDRRAHPHRPEPCLRGLQPVRQGRAGRRGRGDRDGSGERARARRLNLAQSSRASPQGPRLISRESRKTICKSNRRVCSRPW